MGQSMRRSLSVSALFLLTATTAALGLATPAANAGEFSLSFKEGPVEIFYHLGKNPTAAEFQNGKTQLQKLVRKEAIRRQPTTATETGITIQQGDVR